jgi:hypothetical protein
MRINAGNPRRVSDFECRAVGEAVAVIAAQQEERWR